MSRYDLIRRRLAPIAFFVALGLIAKDSCDKQNRTHTTVDLQLGSAAARVRSVELEVATGPAVDAPIVARFHRSALPGSPIGPCRFDLALASDDGELRIDIDLGDQHRKLVRRFHAVENSTMEVNLAGDLAAN